MALRVHAIAPTFDVPGSDGRKHSPASLAGHAYVLTFYPKDETMNCVRQVCALRDVWENFRGKGVLVFGVSRDSVESHQAFAANRKLPYTLLTDATGSMHKDFDVGRRFGVTNRVSYLVGKDGRIAAAFASNLRPAAHAEKMVEALAGL